MNQYNVDTLYTSCGQNNECILLYFFGYLQGTFVDIQYNNDVNLQYMP